MKKLIFLFAFAVTFGVFAAETSSDSFIYWMVDSNASGTVRGGGPLEGTYTAKISAIANGSAWTDQTEGRTYLTIYSMVNGGLGSPLEDQDHNPIVGIGSSYDNRQYFANIASYGSGYTYFVELWNEGGVVARSEGLPYEQASIAALADISTPGTLWAPMTFVAAPEPNSALLLLIGCATLALRRRKQIVA